MDYPIVQQLEHLSYEISKGSVEDFLVNMDVSIDHAPRMSPYSFFPYEKHKFYEIAIQISGFSGIEIGERTYTLKQHQILIIDKSREHRLCIPTQKERCMMLWIAATNETVRPGVSTYIGGKRNKEWALDISAPGAYLIAEIMCELAIVPVSGRVVSKYLSTFIMMIARKLSFAGNIYKSSKKNTVVASVKEYISLHIHEKMTLEDLASHACVSSNYLCALFKQLEGETVFNYIHDFRIKASIPSLLNTENTLQEVAEVFGYCDQFHYSKTFKKFMGMSPASYRATFKKTR